MVKPVAPSPRAYVDELPGAVQPPKNVAITFDFAFAMQTARGSLMVKPGKYRLPWRPWQVCGDEVTFEFDPDDPAIYQALWEQGAFDI